MQTRTGSPGVSLGNEKAIVALIGVAVTTALGLLPPHTTLWIILTIVAAVATTAGFYLVPATVTIAPSLLPPSAVAPPVAPVVVPVVGPVVSGPPGTPGVPV